MSALTRAQREALALLDELFGVACARLLQEYERDLSLPGYLIEHVVSSRDRLMAFQAAIAQVDVRPPYRTVEQVAPLVSAYHAYATELRGRLRIHLQVARRYNGYMGSEYVASGIQEFIRVADRVVASPGMRAAVARHRQALRRQRRTTPNEQPEYRVTGHEPIRVGEISPPFQVVRIEPFVPGQQGGIVYINVENQRQGRMTAGQWIRHRQDEEVARRVLTRLQANPILQFGLGFAEGFSEQVQGILEMLGHLRETLAHAVEMISRIRDLDARRIAEQFLESIMEWGRQFAGADTAHRARMAGRVLGALFFEIVSEIVSGGAVAALRGAVGALRRVRSLHGVFALVDHAADAARVVQRAVSRTFSRAARRVLRARGLIVDTLRHQLLRRAFVVYQGVLEVAGEFVRGSIRRVVQQGQAIFVFIAEGGERLMVNLGRRLELPNGVSLWPAGSICAGP